MDQTASRTGVDLLVDLFRLVLSILAAHLGNVGHDNRPRAPTFLWGPPRPRARPLL